MAEYAFGICFTKVTCPTIFIRNQTPDSLIFASGRRRESRPPVDTQIGSSADEEGNWLNSNSTQPAGGWVEIVVAARALLSLLSDLQMPNCVKGLMRIMRQPPPSPPPPVKLRARVPGRVGINWGIARIMKALVIPSTALQTHAHNGKLLLWLENKTTRALDGESAARRTWELRALTNSHTRCGAMNEFNFSSLTRSEDSFYVSSSFDMLRAVTGIYAPLKSDHLQHPMARVSRWWAFFDNY
jgi:hypothetical protein